MLAGKRPLAISSINSLLLRHIGRVLQCGTGWMGGGVVETRRLRRERETVGEKVCSQHPARETLTLDRALPARPDRSHSPPPIEQPSRTKDKNAKTQNFPARTAARDSLFIKWQLSLDDKSHRCLATLILSEQSPIVNLYDYLLLTAVDSVSSWW